MNITEIKNQLYKEKPEAFLRYIRLGVAYYYADLKQKRVNFEIPVTDMGVVEFKPKMEVKHLIRWIEE